jgi:hypothetical protein
MKIVRGALAVLLTFAMCSMSMAQYTPQQPQQPQQPRQEEVYNDTGEEQVITATQGPMIQYADDQFAVITWSTNASSDSRLFYGTDPANLSQVAEAPREGTYHRVDITKLQPNTTYYFQVDLGQASNVSSTQPMNSFKTVAAGAAAIHNQRPQQAAAASEPGVPALQITSGPTIQYADDVSAVITWSTSEASDGIVHYGTNRNALSQTVQTTRTGTFHRLHLSDLQPNTSYYFQVEGQPTAHVESFRTVASGAQPITDQQPTTYAANSGAPPLEQRPATQPAPKNGLVILSGTDIQASLETALSTKTSQVGDRFTALVTQPVRSSDGQVAIPSGARINGEVTEAEQGKTLPMVRGRGRLNLRFISITLPNNTEVPLQATMTAVGKQTASEEGEVQSKTSGTTAAKGVGIGAGLGTVAGLIMGSALKGLLIGAIAGGGYVLATKGKDVELPANTPLTLQTDQQLVVPAGAVR